MVFFGGGGEGVWCADSGLTTTCPPPPPCTCIWVQIVPNFRVRTIPVLGTTPAIFGLAAAAHILCQLAGAPIVGEPIFRVTVSAWRPALPAVSAVPCLECQLAGAPIVGEPTVRVTVSTGRPAVPCHET